VTWFWQEFPIRGFLNVHSNDLIWQFLELVLGSVVGKKIAVRLAIKWRYVQQGTLSAVNDRVFIEQGARHKPNLSAACGRGFLGTSGLRCHGISNVQR
jgi:hypothetical protein